MMDPSSDKETAAARTELLDLFKKNGRTWDDLQKIMADIDAEKEAAAAAAAVATRAAGWKKEPVFASKAIHRARAALRS
jgi:hypothetical protein